ncbi:putative F-box domain, leucine-rich repeat domain superfamily, F-box-like domain superfamily [Helianthus annuus]|uniref:F-box domain, leucine-rich repeat domain superfamily, F-box-like domain superfamily n=1 Tax=Helianthus annuus TaxID=4232 RepID=A0A251UZZ7_HELAN|nr:F-box protein SKP2A isoform X2 [Helianthus annuus]KAF5809444.1 putative F-box domain, leucine-rich repeat domain superfamily, F-box-like domain superfamily [Helianthus annuus]KAJ0580437.1 putative F-box domain, leucine-rich repeat domain superfamily, F-box-like domain superfamily [Helianthus annuus]KAJ0596395.1 putative F-box domain, leucine-rich repeat domain superfamily, F-box-like domain superfamily [Helianthus annuus]KAJ0926119.1 putative F-box domain, leucine-rich repeat domain superfam
MSTMQGGKLMEFGGGRRVKREWQDIQTELLMKIVSLLDDRTVIVASGVCSGWRNAICSELTHLSLSWCTNNMNNLVLSIVPNFTNLRVLTFRKKGEQPLLDDKSVETIANNCHELEDLDLSMNSRLGDRSLYALARGCPNLTNLNISCCSAFSEHGLDFLSRYCRKLKMLNLFGCYKAATNKALKAIGDNCRQLESINLGRCYEVGDAGVKNLAYGCPHLSVIDLSECFFITDESVIALANNCLHLRSLNLYYCIRITDRAMYALAHSRVKNKDEILWESVKSQYEEEGLMNLNISQCKDLTPPAVHAICDSFPALHTCQGTLNMHGCLKLTSVHCACASQLHHAIHPA